MYLIPSTLRIPLVGFLRWALDLLDVVPQWFDIGIGRNGPLCFMRGCDTYNEWNYGGWTRFGFINIAKVVIDSE